MGHNRGLVGRATVLEIADVGRVCPLAVEDRFIAQRLEGLKGEKLKGLKGEESNNARESDYFLSVGTIEPRKNLELLVRVWEQLLESDGVIPKLIWAGKFGWSSDKQLMRRFEHLQALGHVELCFGLSDSALLELMQGTLALLFPVRSKAGEAALVRSVGDGSAGNCLANCGF